MRFAVATILAVAAATPASAQYMIPAGTSSYLWPGQPAVTETQAVTVRKMQPATGAYAYAPNAYASQQVMRERHSPNPANDVYVNGTYVGSDPDPRIQETLRREAISESSGH